MRINPAIPAILLAAMPAFAADQRLIEGAPASPVRVIIYEDLQCPDCADFRHMLDDQLLPKYASRVTFEHRDFPLAKHAWARPAAIVARYFEDAGTGLGLAWRKYAFANQSDITPENFSIKLSEFAKDHGLEPAKAVGALNNAALAALVEKDFQDGVARGISHTPTALVNGQPFVEHFSFEEISKAIDAELSAK